MLILDPCQRPPVWGLLWRGCQRSSFSLLLNKFHDAFIHLLQSEHSLCFSLIALNKHLILHNFCSFLDPLPETPVWGPFGEGSRGDHFFTTLTNFMIRSYIYFKSDHLLCFSLIALNKHLILHNFFAHFLDPCQRPCLGAPLERVLRGDHFFTSLTNFMIHSYIYFNQIIHFASHSLHWTNISLFTIFLLIFGPPARDPCLGPLWRGFQRRSFFHYFNKFHDTFIHLLQSDHLLCFSLIALNKHLILHNFFAHFGPLPETLFGAPLERVPRGAHFTTLPKFHDAFIRFFQ